MTTAEAPVHLSEARGEASSGGAVYVRVPVAKEAGNWIEVFDVPNNGTQQATDDPSVALRFPDLAEWWHSDTDAMSTDREKFEHVAYQRIIKDLGKPALRFILEDLRDHRGHWFHALRELSGDHSIDAGVQGNMKRARDLWLQWGRSRKLI